MSMAGVQRAPSAASWPLAERLGGFAVPPFESGPRVCDLTLHAAGVQPGCLFLACAGRCAVMGSLGHGCPDETLQHMGRLKVAFSDRAQVVQALGEWAGPRA